ncbi:hypothetical protein IC229_27600 [Spirosoma sp. BT702]|uniref:Uncharacterized protein n=1 Tax=Spirosoma profusum TaxID=2771354 RepID=A0A926Y0X7_9BACT|nr:hypothetical protein [Spirosoma profusum]MBD2704437.1 hypothetical protein [Spirosoma profusum]
MEPTKVKPLFNLTTFASVAIQADEYAFTLQSEAYGYPKHQLNIDDESRVRLHRMCVQARNLWMHLAKLHQTCFDFAAGNIKPYADYWYSFAEPDEEPEPHNPFQDITDCFGFGSATDLPSDIGQYKELLVMVAIYGGVESAKWERYKEQMGDTYLVSGYEQLANGALILWPASKEMKEQREIERLQEAIDVEFCLDNYNKFYEVSQAIIAAHKVWNDHVGCATEILKLFAPRESTLTESVDDLHRSL